MSWPPLESTHISTKMTKAKTSHFDLTPVGTKITDTKPLTQPTEMSKLNGKEHVPEDLGSDPSSSDSSSIKSDLSDDSKYSKSKSNRCNKNKRR